MSKKDLVDNTRNAFDFLTKLYLEVSYLIKEIQGLLDEEEEKFQIGRTFGYGVTGLRSAGLEVANVNQWLLRKFAVFFVPEVMTEITGGVTETSINGDLKILYMRFVLDAKELAEPTLYAGILYEFERKLIDQNSKKIRTEEV